MSLVDVSRGPTLFDCTRAFEFLKHFVVLGLHLLAFHGGAAALAEDLLAARGDSGVGNSFGLLSCLILMH